ncbi:MULTISPECIES: hypothetical protein [unclassified Plantibacter]|jgi:hypothetical protein|uniref:hypothetical protein n=1 Tax=unclassified Plantibacter TaxID=2624265 RepID=UPI003D3548D3
MKKNTAALLGGFAIVGLLLTGCAGGGQSKADACKLISTELTDSAAQLSAAFSGIATDPDKATTDLKKIDTNFGETMDKVSNEDIKKPAQATKESLSKVISLLVAAAADPAKADQTALGDGITAFQTDATDLQTACNS